MKRAVFGLLICAILIAFPTLSACNDGNGTTTSPTTSQTTATTSHTTSTTTSQTTATTSTSTSMTTSTTSTTSTPTTTSATSTSTTSTSMTTSTTDTTTLSKAEPFVLHPDRIDNIYGYTPDTESAAFVQDYVDRGLLLLYKDRDGSSRILMLIALDQPALREWLNSVESYSAYLVLPRTTETIIREQQAIIYSVDMEAWMAGEPWNPPTRSPYINDFSYNFQDLLVSQPDSIGSEISEVWESEIAGLSGESEHLDIIPWGAELVQCLTFEGETGNLQLMVDYPDGTQMTPGTELAWYKSAAIIFFEN